MIVIKNGRATSIRTPEESEALLQSDIDRLTPEERVTFELIVEELQRKGSLPPGETTLLDRIGNAEYKTPPVDIRTFVKDKYFLGATCSNTYEPLMEDLVELFEGGGYQEGVWCLHPDTPIPLPDGTAPTISDLAKKWDSSPKPFWVYSAMPNGTVVQAQAREPRHTGYDEYLKVTLNDGTHFVANPRHQMVLHSGEKKMIRDMRPGTPLMSFREDAIGAEENSYRHVVVSIEKIGFGPVFCMTVPGPANFAICTLKPDGGHVRQGVISSNTGAIGTGKTYVASIVISRILYEISCLRDPYASYDIAADSGIAIVALSVNEDLAREVAFENIITKLKASPYFQENFPFEPTKKEYRFPRNISIAPRATTDTSVLGLNCIAGFLDEASFLPTRKGVMGDSENKAQTIYDGIQRRMKSRFMRQGKLPGMMVIVSSKRTQDDFTAKRIKESINDSTIFVRDRCLTGDTKLPLLDGTVRTMEELAAGAAGETFWLYSLDPHTHQIVPGQARCARRTGTETPVLTVTLDNGDKIRCTANHPFMLRSGSYLHADQLKPGDSLMPFYRRLSDKGYEEISHPGWEGRWQKTHVMAAKAAYGSWPKRGTDGLPMVVHHRNCNKRDNRPANLQIMEWKEHQIWHKEHMEALTAYVKTEKHREWASQRMSELNAAISKNPEAKEKRAARSRAVLARIKEDPETRAKCWASSRAAIAAFHRTERGRELQQKRSITYWSAKEKAAPIKTVLDAATAGESITKLAARLNCSEAAIYLSLKEAGQPSYSKLRVQAGHTSQERPKKSISLDDLIALLTDRGLRTCRSLAEAANVSVPLIQSRLAEAGLTWEGLARKHIPNWKPRGRRSSRAPNNHTVTNISEDGFADVYDLTVDTYHNFAIDSGVFVHNSGWDLRPELYKGQKRFWVLCGSADIGSRILEDSEIESTRATLPEGASLVDVPMDFRRDFERDLEGSIRDIAGISSSSLRPFIQRREKIRAAVDPTLRHPFTTKIYDMAKGGTFIWSQMVGLRNERGAGRADMQRLRPLLHPGMNRHIHVDLGLKHDSAGITMAHVSGWQDVIRRTDEGQEYVERAPKYTVDLMLKIIPPIGGEIVFGEIRTLIYDLVSHGYTITCVSFDSWQSVDSIQQLSAKGLRTETISVDTTPEPYDTLKMALYEDRLQMYEYEPVIEELVKLEENLTGRIRKIDHPKSGSKDVSDSLAGAIFTLSQQKLIQPIPIMRGVGQGQDVWMDEQRQSALAGNRQAGDNSSMPLPFLTGVGGSDDWGDGSGGWGGAF